MISTFIVGNPRVVRAQDMATTDIPRSSETTQGVIPSTSSINEQTGIQPLAADGSSLYYYVEGKRTVLTPSLKWISVRFASDNPTEQSAALQEFGALVGAPDQMRQIPNPKLTLLPLQQGLTVQTLSQGINALRAKSASFMQVNPVFQTEDAEMTITDEFIATFPAGKSRGEINTINSSYGVEIVEPILGQGNTFILRVLPANKVDALAMANQYQESGAATQAAPNFVRILKTTPAQTQARPDLGPMAGTNDFYYSDQWYLNNTQQYGSWMTNDADIDAPEAWDHATGSSAVIIAVIDEGVDLTHEDLIGKLVPGYDATGSGSGGGPWGDDAHGTNVAGIAAASSNNSIGVAGVCQNCRIMPVRIAYGDGYGGWVAYDSWIANGITWAYLNGASILSNSWGGGSPSTVINTAISNAKTLGRGGKGSVVVFAAGNDDTGTVSYPGSLSNVIAVGASNMCDQRKAPINDGCNGYEYWWGSNYGSALDISAPGVWLDSTDIMGAAGYSAGNYFDSMNGTSGATPIVSGVAGLILSLNPNLTANQVQTVLQSTADDVNSGSYPGWDQYMGYGRVNANTAVSWELPSTPITPSGAIGLNYNPTYTWSKVNGANWYLLQVNTNTPNATVIYQWYTSAQANCDATTCFVTSPATLHNGAYTWWVLANNPAGDGPWSAGVGFSVANSGGPGTVTLVSPMGNIGNNYRPTYTWNQDSSATWYLLQVNGPSGQVIYQWYTSAQASCNGTTCFVSPSTTLGVGAYTWWVMTNNSAGDGPWSAGMNFNTTPPTKPGAATLVSPSGNIGAVYNPTYTWNQVSNATWYLLQVNGPSGQVIYQWYSSAQASCNGTTCSVTSATTLAGGSYTWWVMTNNSVGDGPWSAGMNFSMPIPPIPGPANLIAPSGNIGPTHTPIYAWNQVSNASWYYLWVNGPSGPVIQQWYTTAQASCNGSTCSVPPVTALPGGTYNWWVMTHNSTGDGPWSIAMTFTVSP